MSYPPPKLIQGEWGITVPPGSYRALLKRGAEIAKEDKRKRTSTAPQKLSKSEKKRRNKR